MIHLPFAIVAYFFNALSVLANKFLLNKAIPDPLIYIFYISSISFLALLALPFTRTPTFEVFLLSSLSTLLWTGGAYFMFKALKLGQVSRVIPVIGTLIPLTLLVFASQTNAISISQAWAVLLLILGMIFLTAPGWQGKLTKAEIIFEVLSALLFAFSYIVLRRAYQNLDFFSVLIWSRLVLLPFTLVILAIPGYRKKIIKKSGPQLKLLSPPGLIFMGGLISGALSELLILFSISLANPALVNSLQGTQYVFLLILSREKYPLKELIFKIAGVVIIGIGLYILALVAS